MDLAALLISCREALPAEDRSSYSDARLADYEVAQTFLDLPTSAPLREALEALTGHELAATLGAILDSAHKTGPLVPVLTQYFAREVENRETPEEMRAFLGPSEIRSSVQEALPEELAPVRRKKAAPKGTPAPKAATPKARAPKAKRSAAAAADPNADPDA